MDRLRIGVVGGGPWVRHGYAPAIAAHARSDLTALWTRRPEAAEELAAEFGGRAQATFEDLLDQVDAVALAVPPQVQSGLAVEAAKAGKHLICEKPLATSVEDALAVVTAVREAGVLSSMMLTLRHDQQVQEWLAVLPRGPLKNDTLGSACWLSGALLNGPFARSSWRGEHGALLDIGPHLIDMMDAALGPVTGVDWARHDQPDLWRFGLTHAGGAQSTVTTSLRLPVYPSETEFTVFGAAGNHRLIRRPTDTRACFARLLDEFIAAATCAGPPPALDAARGAHLQAVIEQVRVSANRSASMPGEWARHGGAAADGRSVSAQ